LSTTLPLLAAVETTITRRTMLQGSSFGVLLSPLRHEEAVALAAVPQEVEGDAEGDGVRPGPSPASGRGRTGGRTDGNEEAEEEEDDLTVLQHAIPDLLSSQHNWLVAQLIDLHVAVTGVLPPPPSEAADHIEREMQARRAGASPAPPRQTGRGGGDGGGAGGAGDYHRRQQQAHRPYAPSLLPGDVLSAVEGSSLSGAPLERVTAAVVAAPRQARVAAYRLERPSLLRVLLHMIAAGQVPGGTV
jgi:hypothetical protein